MSLSTFFTNRRETLPSDAQSERHVAIIKVFIAIAGLIVALCWFSQPLASVGGWLILTLIVFSVWALFNGVVAVITTESRNVPRIATLTTIMDVAVVGLLDIAILQKVFYDFIAGPHVALYFAIISASSLRHNARLVHLTGVLCAITHLTIVLMCYRIHHIPATFTLVDSESYVLNWMVANDVLISLAMASFGYILGQSTSELIESENHYIALFNSIPDGIIIASAQMKILATNRKFQQMVEMPESELIGKPLQNYFAGKSPALSVRFDASGLQESPFTKLYGQSGNLPVQITQTPIEWNGQRCIELSVRDMSERYELELALARTQKVQTVGKLAGGLAHDFNNILSGIFGAVSLSRRVIGRLENTEETNSFSRYLETISDCGQTATQILERLSTFSRSSIVETATIDILDVLNETVTIMRNTLPANVTIRICDTTNLTVKADKTSLTQALLNLCINAKDAIGHAAGEIVLSAAPIPEKALPENLNLNREREYICIQVKDNGPGMDADTIQQIFDPFFTTKGKDQGTGIGLSMVYNIAFVHGGAVDVVSAPMKETTFFLYIEASRDSLLPLD